MYYDIFHITEFIKAIRPEGLINVGGISPDGGPPIMKTFSLPEEINQAVEYVIRHAEKGINCYAELNPPKEKLNKKAKASDILHVEYIALDCDPDCSNGYEKGRDTIICDTALRVINSDPEPYILNDTGNGIQAIYKLDDPTTDFKKATAISKANAARFNGDNTHSVDHLFRIPGTLNYPDQRKLKKGYPEKPSMSRIIFFRGAYVEY